MIVDSSGGSSGSSESSGGSKLSVITGLPPTPELPMSSETLVAIVTEDKTYEVDKCKLIEESDYFRALYGSGMRESTSDRVRLQGLSGAGLELVLQFIDTSEVRIADDTPLEDLIEAASFLQVTAILERLLPAQICPENCVDLHRLAGVYGAHRLRLACLGYMARHYHAVLRRPEFRRLPTAFRDQVREARMAGKATLLAVGDFGVGESAFGELARLLPRPGTVLVRPDQGATAFSPCSMLRYGGVGGRWEPLVSQHPPARALSEVRGYGWAVLDNYLFVAGGYRAVSRVEVSATHRYDPCGNEWCRVAPLNQKRSFPHTVYLFSFCRSILVVSTNPQHHTHMHILQAAILVPFPPS